MPSFFRLLQVVRFAITPSLQAGILRHPLFISPRVPD